MCVYVWNLHHVQSMCSFHKKKKPKVFWLWGFCSSIIKERHKRWTLLNIGGFKALAHCVQKDWDPSLACGDRLSMLNFATHWYTLSVPGTYIDKYHIHIFSITCKMLLWLKSRWACIMQSYESICCLKWEIIKKILGPWSPLKKYKTFSMSNYFPYASY